jgi:two-component system CheB/CheR fusion protein
MPDIGGYEFIRRVRKDKKAATMKAIALTGHDRDEDKQEALRAGFDAQIGKPVSFDALIREIREKASIKTGKLI